MKPKWHLFILWSVSLLGLLLSEKTPESPSARWKKRFKPGRHSAAGNATSGRKGLAAGGGAAPGAPRRARPEGLDAHFQADFGHLPDVSVSCSASDFVVRVRPSFYGMGADAEELVLGSGCKSNGVLRPYGDLLFTYPLTACDGVRELPHGYLVYKFVLHFEPSPRRFPSRAHRVSVDIQCRYPRDHHVHQLAVQPTWETVVVRKRLKGRPNDFEIHLMDDSWSSPAKSAYQLGETINVQVSAPHLPPGKMLYISSCYAAPSSGPASSHKYIIMDNFGCMLDSRREPGASQFISRTHKALRLSLKAFQFTADPDTEVSIHCKVSVSSEEPGPAHKSCTYEDNRWKALTGDDSICDCCESICVTYKSRRATVEGSASSLPLVVSDQPYVAGEDFLPVDRRTEDQGEINRHAEVPQSHWELWENGGDDQLHEEEEKRQLEERESVFGEMAEPDFEGGWGDYEVNPLNEFEEDGSGYEEGDVTGGDAENAVGQVRDEKRKGETFQSWMLFGQTEENKHEGGRGESERIEASEQRRSNSVADVNDEERTWYFTWS